MTFQERIYEQKGSVRESDINCY